MEKEHTEYRIRPVTRYIVTRCDWVEYDNCTETSGSTRQLGPEYANEDIAFEVAYALARQEAERLECGIADDRVIYPLRPSEASARVVEEDD